MRNKRTLLIAILALVAIVTATATPAVLSLQDCIRMGIERNLRLKTSKGEILKSKYELTANRQKLLPTIEAFGNFTDNVAAGSTVGKTARWGEKPAADAAWMQSTSMRYNTNTGAQLSLPLYDQMLYTSIRIAKQLTQISQLSYDVAREELIIEIGQTYYLAQASMSQLRLADEDIRRLTLLQDITQARLDNGVIMEVDLSRVKYQLEDARVRKGEVETLYAHQLNLLRYQLDLSPDYDFAVAPMDEAQTLTDGVWQGIVNRPSPDLPELQIAQRKIDLAEEQAQLIKHKYLPTLSLVGGLSYTKYEAHFADYFHSDTPRSWYNNFYWGLRLTIPVFDGFQKRTARRKSRIDIENRRHDRENAQLKVETDYANAVSTLRQSLSTYRKQTDNLQLAHSIYSVTMDKYKEGIASMTDLLRDETNISSAQNACVNAFYNYKVAELTLLRLSGQLYEWTIGINETEKSE